MNIARLNYRKTAFFSCSPLPAWLIGFDLYMVFWRFVGPRKVLSYNVLKDSWNLIVTSHRVPRVMNPFSDETVDPSVSHAADKIREAVATSNAVHDVRQLITTEDFEAGSRLAEGIMKKDEVVLRDYCFHVLRTFDVSLVGQLPAAYVTTHFTPRFDVSDVVVCTSDDVGIAVIPFTPLYLLPRKSWPIGGYINVADSACPSW